MPHRKDTFDVGYGKPPREHRFKKGKSGNPKGRPRGAQNKSSGLPIALNPVHALVLRELGEPMPVMVEGERVDLSALQVVLRKLKIDAARGDFRKMKFLLEIARAVGEQEQSERAARIAFGEDYKRKWMPVFDAALEEGMAEPSQLPHPRHVGVCPKTIDLSLNGPQDKDEKEYWDLLKGVLRLLDDDLHEAELKLEVDPQSAALRERVDKLASIIAENELKVPHGWNWRECVTDQDRAYYADRRQRFANES